MLSSRKRAAAYFKYLRPSVAHTPILPRALDTVKFWSIISLYSVIIFVRFNRTPIDTQSLPDSYPTITAKEGQRWDERGAFYPNNIFSNCERASLMSSANRAWSKR